MLESLVITFGSYVGSIIGIALAALLIWLSKRKAAKRRDRGPFTPDGWDENSYT